MKKIFGISILVVLSIFGVSAQGSSQVSAQVARKNTAQNLDFFAPEVVANAPSDAYIGLSLMEDGELRHYNYGERKTHDRPYYMSSRDNGKSWREVGLADGVPYADLRSPVTGEYVRAFHNFTNMNTLVMRTEGGIEGTRIISVLDSSLAIMLKPPVFVGDGSTVLIAAHGVGGKGCHTYVSKDNGVSWSKSNVINTPPHQIGGFHKGLRWNHGAVEPTVVELADGRIWMIMRTSLDHHYQSFSEDQGMTWSEPTPSPFYGTITMPTFQRLGDGRLMFLWSNTTSLPEVESATGRGEDVFTNRSATHIAISEDDGKTWIGMRELFLDLRRNAEDFASMPGSDKSVHQAQAVEIAPGKIIAAVGQHPLHRKILRFDIDWLYETNRQCDFSDSLDQWSAFWYYKGIVGHCGYNRTEMPLITEHPDNSSKKVMRIGYTPNDTLVQDNQGALWNFPAARSGMVELSMMFPEGSETIDLVLNDRWFNPTDTVSKYECQYTVPLSRQALKIRDQKWHNIRVEWTEGKNATLFVDNKKVKTLKLKDTALHGISYLHLLGRHTPDTTGVMIERVKAQQK